jgi:hypothetical protein
LRIYSSNISPSVLSAGYDRLEKFFAALSEVFVSFVASWLACNVEALAPKAQKAKRIHKDAATRQSGKKCAAEKSRKTVYYLRSGVSFACWVLLRDA